MIVVIIIIIVIIISEVGRIQVTYGRAAFFFTPIDHCSEIETFVFRGNFFSLMYTLAFAVFVFHLDF